MLERRFLSASDWRRPCGRRAAALIGAALMAAGGLIGDAAEVVWADVLINDVEVVGAAPVAVAAAPGPADQFRRQLEPLVKVELSFAARASGATEAERRLLVAAGKKWFDGFLEKYGKQANRGVNRRIIVVNGQVQVQGATTNYRDAVVDGVADVVRKTLPREKAARCDEERRQREEFARQAGAENLVARIDEQLLLSPEQREKITQSLLKHWDKSWAPQMEVMMMNTNMWPRLPDQHVRAELTPAQQAVWARLQSGSQTVIWGGGIALADNNQQVIDDIELPAEGEADANAEQPK